MKRGRDLPYFVSYPFPIILPVVMPSRKLFKRARDMQTNMHTNEILIGAGSRGIFVLEFSCVLTGLSRKKWGIAQ